MAMSPTAEKFILHWGEMGARWGVNRTVGQIHALLFLADAPMNAEEIQEALGVARSNVSNSLKELQSWGLVRSAPVKGDRREHFVAEQDVWQIFRLVVEGRKRREIDPTLTVLRECAIEGSEDAALDRAAHERMENVLAFLELLMSAYADFQHLPAPALQRFLSMGGKMARLLEK